MSSSSHPLPAPVVNSAWTPAIIEKKLVDVLATIFKLLPEADQDKLSNDPAKRMPLKITKELLGFEPGKFPYAAKDEKQFLDLMKNNEKEREKYSHNAVRFVYRILQLLQSTDLTTRNDWKTFNYVTSIKASLLKHSASIAIESRHHLNALDGIKGSWMLYIVDDRTFKLGLILWHVSEEFIHKNILPPVIDKLKEAAIAYLRKKQKLLEPRLRVYIKLLKPNIKDIEFGNLTHIINTHFNPSSGKNVSSTQSSPPEAKNNSPHSKNQASSKRKFSFHEKEDNHTKSQDLPGSESPPHTTPNFHHTPPPSVSTALPQITLEAFSGVPPLKLSDEGSKTLPPSPSNGQSDNESNDSINQEKSLADIQTINQHINTYLNHLKNILLIKIPGSFGKYSEKTKAVCDEIIKNYDEDGNIKNLADRDRLLEITIRKCKLMRYLDQMINDNNTDPTTRIEQFNEDLISNIDTINAAYDDASNEFLVAIITTIGSAYNIAVIVYLLGLAPLMTVTLGFGAVVGTVAIANYTYGRFFSSDKNLADKHFITAVNPDKRLAFSN